MENNKLPKTSDEVLFGRYRVPRTNQTLDGLGFDGDDKDYLFIGYGKKAVLNSLAIYFGAKTNLQREEAKEDLGKIRSGLVATMESIRTNNSEPTITMILEEKDILKLMQKKYEGDKKPKARLRTEANLIIVEALEYLVAKYIKGLKDVKKPDIDLSARRAAGYSV